MATKYADENGFEYDAYLKYRSDLIADDMPDIQKTVERKVFSVVPSCDFTEPLVNRETKTLGPEVPIVSDAVAYGNRAQWQIIVILIILFWKSIVIGMEIFQSTLSSV